MPPACTEGAPGARGLAAPELGARLLISHICEREGSRPGRGSNSPLGAQRRPEGVPGTQNNACPGPSRARPGSGCPGCQAISPKGWRGLKRETKALSQHFSTGRKRKASVHRVPASTLFFFFFKHMKYLKNHSHTVIQESGCFTRGKNSLSQLQRPALCVCVSSVPPLLTYS